MEAPRIHRALRDLLAKAISGMEDTALRCNEAAEQLEDGELLAALGNLSGCENTIRTTSVIVRAAHDWQMKSNQDPINQVAEA
jgi:hypothetical protein